MTIHAALVTDELTGAHAVAQTLFLQILGEAFIEIAGMSDVLDLESTVRGILGEYGYGTQTESENRL